jgi:hypothetical protein
MPSDSGLEPLRLLRTLAVHARLLARMRPLRAEFLVVGRVRLVGNEESPAHVLVVLRVELPQALHQRTQILR